MCQAIQALADIRDIQGIPLSPDIAVCQGIQDSVAIQDTRASVGIQAILLLADIRGSQVSQDILVSQVTCIQHILLIQELLRLGL